jgi:hypothetical protein
MRTTGWVGVVAFLCIAVYVGMRPAGAWIAGVALGMADLAVLDRLLRELLGRRRPGALAAAFLVKFAGLYALGAALIFLAHLPAVPLLAGFPLFLGIIVLKVAGRMLMGARGTPSGRGGDGSGWKEARP